MEIVEASEASKICFSSPISEPVQASASHKSCSQNSAQFKASFGLLCYLGLICMNVEDGLIWVIGEDGLLLFGLGEHGRCRWVVLWMNGEDGFCNLVQPKRKTFSPDKVPLVQFNYKISCNFSYNFILR